MFHPGQGPDQATCSFAAEFDAGNCTTLDPPPNGTNGLMSVEHSDLVAGQHFGSPIAVFNRKHVVGDVHQPLVGHHINVERGGGCNNIRRPVSIEVS